VAKPGDSQTNTGDRRDGKETDGVKTSILLREEAYPGIPVEPKKNPKTLCGGERNPRGEHTTTTTEVENIYSIKGDAKSRWGAWEEPERV